MRLLSRRNLSRFILVSLVSLVLVAAAGAQTTSRALQAYQDRFRDAEPAMKLQILTTADMLTVEELGPLYGQAIEFALSNAGDLDSDSTLQQIVLFASEKIAEGVYTGANTALWNIFTETVDNTLRISVLDTLAVVAQGDRERILDLNGWIQAQTNLYRGGVVPDLQVVRKAVVTAGALGDPTSFPMLLDVLLSQFSDQMTQTAAQNMHELDGDYVDMAIAAVNQRSLGERQTALSYFVEDLELSDQQRARIATEVLSATLNEVVRDVTQQRLQRELRYRAIQVLMGIPYEPASTPVIRHFQLTIRDYDQNVVTKSWLLDSITAVGTVGTAPAARVLTTYLSALNRVTEFERPADTQVVLAVVNNLDRLGYDLSYDALFYTTILDYPQNIKDAARQALDNLAQ